MNKYLEAEKRLAELLGVVVYFDALKDEEYPNGVWAAGIPEADTYYGETQEQAMLNWLENTARWTRDNAAAFALMVEHGCWPYINDILTDRVHVSVPSVRDDGPVCSELVRDHPDKETAVRFAIVMAVIAKLESKS